MSLAHSSSLVARCVCVHTCVVLEKTSIHKVVQQMPSLCHLCSLLCDSHTALLAALRRTAGPLRPHSDATTPIFEFFSAKVG